MSDIDMAAKKTPSDPKKEPLSRQEMINKFSGMDELMPTNEEIQLTKDALDRDMCRLLQEFFFFGLLCTEFNIVPTSPVFIRTACINAYTLYLPCVDIDRLPKNHPFLEEINKTAGGVCLCYHKMGQKARMALLLHELSHAALMHFYINRDLNHEVANIAMDIVINNMLKKTSHHSNYFNALLEACPGCVNPEGNTVKFAGQVLEIPDLDNKDWRVIYDDLLNNKNKGRMSQCGICTDPKDNGNNPSDGEGDGEGASGNSPYCDVQFNDPDSLSPEQQQQMDNLKVRIISASSKSQGTVPEGMKRYIEDLGESKVDWKSEFRNLICTTIVRDDYTWRTNPRLQHLGGLPLMLRTEVIGPVWFAIDTSGCYVKGTMLFDSNGGLKRIENVREKDTLVSCSFDTTMINSSMNTFKYKAKNLIKITTATGKEIVSTPNHHSFTVDVKVNPFKRNVGPDRDAAYKALYTSPIVEKRADEFKEGDYMFSLSKIEGNKGEVELPVIDKPTYQTGCNHPILPQYFTPEFCEFIGYLIGDGHVSLCKNSITTHMTDESSGRLVHYQSLLANNFNLKSNLKTSTRQRLFVNSASFTKYLATTFPEICVKSPQREIPYVMTTLKDECIAKLLRGLFDAEGTVGHHFASFVNTSKALVEQYQLLLLRFGIVAHMSECLTPEREVGGHTIKETMFYKITVGTKYLREFKELIGTSCKNKAKRLDEAIANCSFHHAIVKNTIPYKDGILLEKIKKIEKIEGDWVDVYDVEVENLHNYTANGIITHNSMGHDEIADGIAEVIAARNAVPFPLRFCTCDAQVYEIQKWDASDPVDHEDLDISGGGGTSFVPIFEAVDEDIHTLGEIPSCVVVFTDTFGDCPPDYHPQYPVIWVSTSNVTEMPFGRVINVN